MKKNKVAAEIWFRKAKDHLAFAKAGWKESKIVSDTCVLCQQAVENVNIKKTPPLRTHRLADIVEECKKYYPEVEDYGNDCDKLTVYYFDRYPADVPLNLTDKDARFAIQVAEKILIFVKAIILKV